MLSKRVSNLISQEIEPEELIIDQQGTVESVLHKYEIQLRGHIELGLKYQSLVKAAEEKQVNSDKKIELLELENTKLRKNLSKVHYQLESYQKIKENNRQGYFRKNFPMTSIITSRKESKNNSLLKSVKDQTTYRSISLTKKVSLLGTNI